MSPRELEMRETSLRAGVQGSALLCAVIGTWLWATPERPHRGALLALVGAFALLAAAIRLIPPARITMHRHVLGLFAVWSVVTVTGISAAVALDGGAGGLSPLTLTYVTPLLFAALAYPLRMVVAISLLDALACAATLALATALPVADIVYVTALLLVAAWLCATHALAHQRHAAESERLSRTDVLTGALNRRGFDDELARRVARHERYGTPFGLVLFDLDAFKDVNDRLGHAAGDELLQRVAGAALDSVRATDVVCRMGGDEFAVLLDVAGAAATRHAAIRLSSALSEHAPVSVGWAACPEDAADPGELYRRADAELYRDKSFAPAPSAPPHPAASRGVAPAA